LTGGEPTVRAHLPVLIEKLAALGTDLATTTNGATMGLLADELHRSGLRRVNISLDSLQRERFLEMTRRDALEKVLDGIDAAVAAGFAKVKVNCVMMRDVNDDEVVDFARFGRERGVEVRFIEFMPLDADGAWGRSKVVPGHEIVERIAAVYPIGPVAQGSDPAAVWRYTDGAGQIGVINSVTEPFCGNCDRVRLTADGKFRNCLFAVHETDLRSILRHGGTDDDLAAAVASDVGQKWAGHSIGKVNFIRPARSMSQIGG